MIHIYDIAPQEGKSEDAELTVDGKACPLHEARVSAVPFNRRWPGHQRSKSQTELVSFGLFATDGPARIVINPRRKWQTAVIRPLSSGCQVQNLGNGEIAFEIPGPGFYSVDLDGIHKGIFIFADPLSKAAVPSPGTGVIYYGSGYHEVGMIELHDNETLFLDEGAVVFACIHAKDAKNIRILGPGILDGSHNVEQPLPDIDPLLLEEQRKKGFEITNVSRRDTIVLEFCENVTIDGITIRDSLLYTVRPIGCKNLKIENLKVIGNWRYNSDGIDMHNSEDVVIRHCFLRTYDDTICVKGFDYTMNMADMVHGGKYYDVSRNVLVEDCVLWNDWGIVLEIGAETRAREIYNVTFRNCDIIHHAGAACNIQNVDYADVHDITFENIRVEYKSISQPQRLQFSEEEVYEETRDDEFQPLLMSTSIFPIPEYAQDGDRRGTIRSILFKDIAVIATRMPPSIFAGFDDEHQSRDLTIENLTLNGQKLRTLPEANVTVGKFAAGITLNDSTGK